MSSATSTEPVRLKPDPAHALEPTNTLQPWQFFVLAALGCATAVTFVARGQGVTVVVLLGVLMAATALVGLAVLRTVRPLVSRAGRPHRDDRPAHARGARAREDAGAALDQGARVRSRDGKLSEADLQEMSGRLRARARAADAPARRRRRLPRADRARACRGASSGRTPITAAAAPRTGAHRERLCGVRDYQ